MWTVIYLPSEQLGPVLLVVFVDVRERRKIIVNRFLFICAVMVMDVPEFFSVCV